MATIDPEAPQPQSLARTTLTARAEERFIAPFKRSRAARVVFFATVGIVLALHGGVLLYILRKETMAPPKEEAKETAVEIVVEPPPPPPAPEKPADKAEIEKPAMSAPRAPNEDKTETEKLDTETRAPKAPTPPADGKPDPETPASAPETPPDKPDVQQTQAAKPADPRLDAEALDRASPEPKPDPAPPKAVTPPVTKRSAKTALQKLAGASSLPDYKFAKPTKKSPVWGGTEDSRYLAIVYAMIMQKFHPGGFVMATGGATTIAFELDESGHVLAEALQARSGDDDFDRAALSAVARASPFPPPPPGSPHGLVARIAIAEHR